MINSHYVPMLTLRRFGEKICTYNVRTGQFRENVNIKRAFSEKGFYSNEVEEALNKKIESQFGNLFANKLNDDVKELSLSLEEVQLIKKFLLISVIRSMGNEEFMQVERRFYEMANEKALEMGISAEEIKNNPIKPPFIEKEITGESSFDYWMRTLNVILDTNGTPEEIINHPDKTYPAHRWAQVINNGYLAFWDSNFVKEEYVLTDIGMTSENEKGWNGITVHNLKKTNFLLKLLENETDERYQFEIYKNMSMHYNFSENFMMFPISPKRMIVEIDPFYKFRIAYRSKYVMPQLSELTNMDNEDLFYPNDNKYVYKQNGVEWKRHPNDRYIYKIKQLSIKETRYCNELFLDRINTFVGFSNLNKVAGSVFAYKRANSYPYVPRVDYTGLYKIISERFDSNIDLDSIMVVNNDD